jgi:hypothetical protein
MINTEFTFNDDFSARSDKLFRKDKNNICSRTKNVVFKAKYFAMFCHFMRTHELHVMSLPNIMKCGT